jgi:hypothetical protein
MCILDVIYLIYFTCRFKTFYNFNYTPKTLPIQSWREIAYGSTRTKNLKTTELGDFIARCKDEANGTIVLISTKFDIAMCSPTAM